MYASSLTTRWSYIFIFATQWPGGNGLVMERRQGAAQAPTLIDAASMHVHRESSCSEGSTGMARPTWNRVQVAQRCSVVWHARHDEPGRHRGIGHRCLVRRSRGPDLGRPTHCSGRTRARDDMPFVDDLLGALGRRADEEASSGGVDEDGVALLVSVLPERVPASAARSLLVIAGGDHHVARAIVSQILAGDASNIAPVPGSNVRRAAMRHAVNSCYISALFCAAFLEHDAYDGAFLQAQAQVEKDHARKMTLVMINLLRTGFEPSLRSCRWAGVDTTWITQGCRPRGPGRRLPRPARSCRVRHVVDAQRATGRP